MIDLALRILRDRYASTIPPKPPDAAAYRWVTIDEYYKDTPRTMKLRDLAVGTKFEFVKDADRGIGAQYHNRTKTHGGWKYQPVGDAEWLTQIASGSAWDQEVRILPSPSLSITGPTPRVAVRKRKECWLRELKTGDKFHNSTRGGTVYIKCGGALADVNAQAVSEDFMDGYSKHADLIVFPLTPTGEPIYEPEPAPAQVRFDTLQPGDLFMHENVLHMKVVREYDSNAIKVPSGLAVTMFGWQLITPLTGTLHVEVAG